MNHLQLQSLPWLPDSRALLKKIGALPGAACLDSGLTRRPEARYDILTALPRIQLKRMRNPQSGQIGVWQRAYDEQTWQICAEADVFVAAQRLLAAHEPAAEIRADLRHLPFCGGLLGALAYPCGQDSRSGFRTDQTAPDAAVLHAQPEAWFGLYQWAVIVDHERQTTVLFILPDCPASIREQVWLALGGPEDPTAPSFSLTAPFRALSTAHDYASAYTRLKHWISAGDCYQANLAIAFSTGFSGNPLAAYLSLRHASRSPFSAYLNCELGHILSLSPERFLAVNDQNVLTQPIKGTRRRSSDPDEDREIVAELLSSSKDRAENLMIVDLLRNDLGRVCVTGSVQTPALFSLHSFSHVHHLVSTVTGRLPATTSPLNLMAQAFPGGSITGAPKIRAMQIISELEPVPRSIYCGSILYLDFNGHLDSNICIRTLLCVDQQIFCWGGGGIVADSECNREYQECHDKVMALMQTLGG
jgi:para-aminobenzoate synthetase component I